jgi:hypothetical protein
MQSATKMRSEGIWAAGPQKSTDALQSLDRCATCSNVVELETALTVERGGEGGYSLRVAAVV